MAPMPCGARARSLARQPPGNGATSVGGCAAAGPDRFSLSPPKLRVSVPRGAVRRRRVSFLQGGGHQKGGAQRGAGGPQGARRQPALRAAASPSAAGQRRPLRAAPRAALPDRRTDGQQPCAGPACAAPGRPLLPAGCVARRGFAPGRRLRLKMRGRGGRERGCTGSPAAAGGH